MPFVNLNAMVMMGVAVLADDVPLFKMAYKTFTGEEYKQVIVNFSDRLFWSVIRALPRSVPLSGKTNIQDAVRKIFAVAA